MVAGKEFVIMRTEELAKYGKELEWYLATSNGIGVVLLDIDLTIQDCNLGFMRLFNPRQNPAGEPLADYLDLDGSEIRYGEELRLPCSRKSGIGGIIYCYIIRKEFGHLLLCERLVLTESRALEQIGAMNDELINLQREMVKKNRFLEKLKLEMDSRIVELEAALVRCKSIGE
jgi:hypothetical protein